MDPLQRKFSAASGVPHLATHIVQDIVSHISSNSQFFTNSLIAVCGPRQRVLMVMSALSIFGIHTEPLSESYRIGQTSLTPSMLSSSLFLYIYVRTNYSS
ncbi:hypothetical protein Droror1_Dr00022176 [Drosera rotundifolia]